MKVIMTLTLMAWTSLAGAEQIDWIFSGTNFVNDNGTLTGSFTYDADTALVSNVAVSTTAGDLIVCTPNCGFAETFAGVAYDLGFPVEFEGGNVGIYFYSNTADTALLLIPVAPLDNAGGAREIVQIREWRCPDAPAFCPRDIAVTPFRSVFEGLAIGDNDDIAADIDNCIIEANPDQTDTDGDNIGNRCDADIAIPNDCFVNFPDLQTVKDAFFSTPASPSWNPDADFIGPGGGPPDGIINFLDLEVIKNAFFQAPGPSAQGCN